MTAGSETYKAAGSADEPLTASWTYVVKAAGGDDDSSGSDKNDASGKVSVTTDKQAGNFAAGGLVSTADELKKAVLTDSDKAAMADGKNINIWLEMKDQSTTVSDSDKAAITATLPSDCEVGIYLDINLWKQIEGNEEAKVTETNGTVKIAFTIPESLQKTDRVYQIIRLHNGEVEALDTIVDENYGLTFETIGFSTYALVYRDKVSAAEKDTTTTTTTTTTTDTTTTAAATDTTAVKTGDNTNVVPYILLIMFVFVGFAGVYARRKRL